MTVIAAMSAQATIPVEQAVGMVLPHDITEIVRDSSTVGPVWFAPDDLGPDRREAIGACLADGAELVVTSATCSRDLDDVTRLGTSSSPGPRTWSTARR